MPRCTCINNLHEIDLSSNWTPACKFASKDRIVTEAGEPVGADYSGRTFKLVAKYVHDIPFFERVASSFWGVTKMLSSFGDAQAIQAGLRLITKKRAMRFAVPVVLTEQEKIDLEEIEKKHANTWTCVKRTPNTSGGYLYTFRAHDAYDQFGLAEQNILGWGAAAAFQQKQQEIFPAIEQNSLGVLIFDPTLSDEDTIKYYFPSSSGKQITEQDRSMYSKALKVFYPHAQYRKEFWQLGYETKRTDERTYVTLPDREALLARWQELRKSQPELPQLDISSSERIADDGSFIDAYLKHDVLLSSGQEFLHDNCFHVVSTLTRMLSSGKDGNPTYMDIKSKIKNLISPVYQDIMVAKNLIENPTSEMPDDIRSSLTRDLDKVEAALSAVVDDLSNLSYDFLEDKIRTSLISSMKAIADDWIYKKYWEKRFGRYQMSGQIIDKVLSQIHTIVPSHPERGVYS
jgi:hypothetical protein